jgi:hypothetical protein
MKTKNTGTREKDERALLDHLLEDSRLYKSGPDYLALLEFIARMRNFAPFNALLLQIQNRDFSSRRPNMTGARFFKPK